MRNRSNHGRRRGVILVAATWLIIILAAMTILLASRMSVETQASANLITRAQAETIERGAEQYVLSRIDKYAGDPVSIVDEPMEALQVGEGYFWVLRANLDDPNIYDFGITDECSKINLNTANNDTLLMLPGITEDIAEAITTWRSSSGATAQNGAGESYYMSLDPPYHCKAAPFESVEELLLVRGVTKELLFGNDLNQNAATEDAEVNATTNANGGFTSALGAYQNDERGLFHYVTVFTSPTTSTSSSGGTSGTSGSSSGAASLVNVNNASAIRSLLQSTYSSSRATQIISSLGQQTNFSNIFAFAIQARLTPEEFALIAGQITATSTSGGTGGGTSTTSQGGKVNVNTASVRVLACLPGMDQTYAEALVQRRQSTDDVTAAWILGVLPASLLQGTLGNMLTGQSYWYSADIVAVSGDGRSFKRVRIVIDAQATPAKIIYRKDLSDLGWPLAPEIRESLKRGEGVPGVPMVVKGGR